MSKNKWLTLTGILTMLLLMTGCSDSKSTQEKKIPNQGATSKENNPQTITKLESDTVLTQQLEAEKGIEKVMVQVVEGQQPAVNVVIQINNEQELSADEVVEKYSEDIKKKYPDRTIDISVAKDGKIIKHVTVQK